MRNYGSQMCCFKCVLMFSNVVLQGLNVYSKCVVFVVKCVVTKCVLLLPKCVSLCVIIELKCVKFNLKCVVPKCALPNVLFSNVWF